MSEAVDQEINAIKTVLSVLQPLDSRTRANVVDYVVKRLAIEVGAGGSPSAGVADSRQGFGAPSGQTEAPAAGPVHIETLKKEKSPRSANEMAALVAYYLSHVAPSDKRKTTVNTHDIETYFKIAKFPLPRQPRVTLQNARNAGYFDSVGSGEYRLNPVGYNLVAHSMPRGAQKTTTAPKKKSTRKPRKKAKRRR